MQDRLLKATAMIWETNQSVLTVWNIKLCTSSEAHTQKWKRGGLHRKKKTPHAIYGGLFRCQEVCVMVIGQMREEGWSRPLCFEDSPPRPVRLHHSHHTPKTKEQTRSKKVLLLCAHACVCTCFCLLYFSRALDSTSNQISALYSSLRWEIDCKIHKLNTVCWLKKGPQKMVGVHTMSPANYKEKPTFFWWVAVVELQH